MRLGIVVNPDAGLGDWGSRAAMAERRKPGGRREDRAGHMHQCLNHLVALASSSLNRSDVNLELLTWEGRMGGTVALPARGRPRWC